MHLPASVPEHDGPSMGQRSAWSEQGSELGRRSSHSQQDAGRAGPISIQPPPRKGILKSWGTKAGRRSQAQPRDAEGGAAQWEPEAEKASEASENSEILPAELTGALCHCACAWAARGCGPIIRMGKTGRNFHLTSILCSGEH